MVGRESEEFEIAELGSGGGELTVREVWEALEERHPELEGLRERVRVAVNREFATGDVEIGEGDEVALIPPVSGGSGEGAPGGGGDEASDAGEGLDGEKDGGKEGAESEEDTWRRREGRFCVTRRPLSVEAVQGQVRRSEAGAIVTFEGVVRDHTGDHSVDFLEYECYGAMAVEKLVETAAEATERWPEVETAVHHRWGRLEIGERAVVIAVSSPHRAEAFEACRYVIDRLKEVVPIWKKEVGPEGEEWVGWGP